jgi:hypothetical protein
MKTPQIKPDWDTGIYIGNGTIVPEPFKSYAPMMIISETETAGNALRFATEQEALNSAKELFSRWTTPQGYEVHETTDLVNYRFENGRNERITE